MPSAEIYVTDQFNYQQITLSVTAVNEAGESALSEPLVVKPSIEIFIADRFDFQLFTITATAINEAGEGALSDPLVITQCFEIFVIDKFSFETFPITASCRNEAGDSEMSDPLVLNRYIPSSIVCFLEGTPVLSDQGYVEIQDLKAGKHTFDGYDLKCITITKSLDPFLIKISANCFENNVPSHDLVTTFHHKVFVNGKYIEAGRLLNHYPGVQAIEYCGELLYNMVLEEHHKVSVYNIMCETLAPDCEVARYFMDQKTFENSKMQSSFL